MKKQEEQRHKAPVYTDKAIGLHIDNRDMQIDNVVPRHPQSTAEVPSSKVPNPQVLGFIRQLVLGCTLPSSLCSWDRPQHPPLGHRGQEEEKLRINNV